MGNSKKLETTERVAIGLFWYLVISRRGVTQEVQVEGSQVGGEYKHALLDTALLQQIAFCKRRFPCNVKLLVG